MDGQDCPSYRAEPGSFTVVSHLARRTFPRTIIAWPRPKLIEPPQVLGPMSLGDWAVTVRVMVKTRPGQQWLIGRELRKHILGACAKAGVELPYPRQEILVRKEE